MGESNADPDEVAIVGAGVVGCAVSWALTKAGRRVVLIDRAEPAFAGASFGNVGHIATEQLQPLPSPQLLLNFWRELVAFGGALDLPLHRIVTMTPWITRFVCAAFKLRQNTAQLAPLVRCAADTLESQLSEVGRRDLVRRNGHYVMWLGPRAPARAAADRARAAALGIATSDAPRDVVRAVAARVASAGVAGGTAADGRAGASGTHAASAGATGSNTVATDAAGVWYPDTAHVLDPMLVARSFATASTQAGATLLHTSVRHLRPAGNRIEVVTDSGTLTFRTVVVCAGAWSAPLLAPFGVRAPLEAERGYHIELPNHAPVVDAPILYADHSVFVTPMEGRIRASSYLEFAGLNSPPDPRKPARLRTYMRRLGYQCDNEGPSWMGPRPTLPDYLPGIGRARGEHALFYAVGHQHLGLTLSAVTADLIADLVAGRKPRFDVTAFDLSRFGTA